MALNYNYENTMKTDKPLKMTKPVGKLVPLTILRPLKLLKLEHFNSNSL